MSEKADSLYEEAHRIDKKINFIKSYVPKLSYTHISNMVLYREKLESRISQMENEDKVLVGGALKGPLNLLSHTQLIQRLILAYENRRLID